MNDKIKVEVTFEDGYTYPAFIDDVQDDGLQLSFENKSSSFYPFNSGNCSIRLPPVECDKKSLSRGQNVDVRLNSPGGKTATYWRRGKIKYFRCFGYYLISFPPHENVEICNSSAIRPINRNPAINKDTFKKIDVKISQEFHEVFKEAGFHNEFTQLLNAKSCHFFPDKQFLRVICGCDEFSHVFTELMAKAGDLNSNDFQIVNSLKDTGTINELAENNVGKIPVSKTSLHPASEKKSLSHLCATKTGSFVNICEENRESLIDTPTEQLALPANRVDITECRSPSSTSEDEIFQDVIEEITDNSPAERELSLFNSSVNIAAQVPATLLEEEKSEHICSRVTKPPESESKKTSADEIKSLLKEEIVSNTQDKATKLTEAESFSISSVCQTSLAANENSYKHANNEGMKLECKSMLKTSPQECLLSVKKTNTEPKSPKATKSISKPEKKHNAAKFRRQRNKSHQNSSQHYVVDCYKSNEKQYWEGFMNVLMSGKTDSSHDEAMQNDGSKMPLTNFDENSFSAVSKSREYSCKNADEDIDPHTLFRSEEFRNLVVDNEPAAICQGFYEEFELPEHLMGLAIGKRGSNLFAARKISGVTTVELVENTCCFRIYGLTDEAVKAARSKLEFDEVFITIDKQYYELLVEKSGKMINNLIEKTGLVRIVIDENDGDLSEKCHILTLVGHKEIISDAKTYIEYHSYVMRRKIESLQKNSLPSPIIFDENLSISPNKTNKNVSSHTKFVCVKKKLMGRAIGKNGANIKKAESLNGVMSIRALGKKPIFVINGTSEEAIEKAGNILKYDSMTLSIDEKELKKLTGTVISQISRESGIVFEIPQKYKVSSFMPTEDKMAYINVVGPSHCLKSAKQLINSHINSYE